MKARHGWLWGKSSYKTKIVHKQKCKFFCMGTLVSKNRVQMHFSALVTIDINYLHLQIHSLAPHVYQQWGQVRECSACPLNCMWLQEKSSYLQNLGPKDMSKILGIQKTSCQMSYNADFLLSWRQLKQVLKMC